MITRYHTFLINKMQIFLFCVSIEIYYPSYFVVMIMRVARHTRPMAMFFIDSVFLFFLIVDCIWPI